MLLSTLQKNRTKTVPAPSTARGGCGPTSPKSLGFTLVELMVSISIFAVITAVVLIRNNEFNSGILFSNLVYEIALSIREMQTYGITVRASDAGTFKNGYGVYFDTVNTPNSFVQFIDQEPGDRLYSESEKLTRFNLKPGNSIEKLCDLTSGSCSPVSSLAITFMRPEPDARITYSGYSGAPITKAGIVIKSPGTTDVVRKCIVVTGVGQISVQNYNGVSCAQ